MDGVDAEGVDKESKPLAVDAATPVCGRGGVLPGAAGGRSTCLEDSWNTGIHGSLW